MNNHYIQNSSVGNSSTSPSPEVKTEWPVATLPSSNGYALQQQGTRMVQNWQQQFDEAAKAELERMRSYSGGNEGPASVASVRSPFLMDLETSSASSKTLFRLTTAVLHFSSTTGFIFGK